MDSPEWIEACQAFNEAVEEQNRDMEAWWNNLSDRDQQYAFYNVCRLIYKGDVEERRSYRGVLYDIFGWGPEAYALGMEARYMELHNLLYDAVERKGELSQDEIDSINDLLNKAADDECQTCP